MTSEEELRSKLDQIRESVTATRFATEALLSRVARIESEAHVSDKRIDQLSERSIRDEETMKTILKSMHDMSADIRSVRNSVLSTIVGASTIWLVGTAVTTLYSHPDNVKTTVKTQAAISKNV